MAVKQEELKIEDAVRGASYLKMAIAGPSGAGKTFSSLLLAKELAEGGLIIGIDTQQKQMSKQAGKAGLPAFKVINMEHYSVDAYLRALRLAYEAKAKVIIVDSISDEWESEGGILEHVGATRNQFGDGWKTGTPQHQMFLRKLIAVPVHTISTMRADVAHIQEFDAKENKTVIRNIGIQPVQRKRVEYSFDLYGMMSMDHTLKIEKSIMDSIAVGDELEAPGSELGQYLLKWAKGEAA